MEFGFTCLKSHGPLKVLKPFVKLRDGSQTFIKVKRRLLLQVLVYVRCLQGRYLVFNPRLVVPTVALLRSRETTSELTARS